MSDTLREFASYVTERSNVLDQILGRLRHAQAKYEAFFKEVCSVRESELQQLSAHIAAGRGHLPSNLDAELETAALLARDEFERKFNGQVGRCETILTDAESARQRALTIEPAAHRENLDLDGQEEALKARNQVLLGDITKFENSIRAASTGFGFLLQLPQLRRLQKAKHEIEQEQVDICAHIEVLRARWAARAPEVLREIENLEGEWTKQMKTASQIQARIEYLRNSRERIIGRSALELLLFQRAPQPTSSVQQAAPCPRCGACSATSRFFCAVCAERLGPDRPDFEGSMGEIAELNLHHRQFSDAMRAGQELIALFSGIRSGLHSFKKSLSSMIATESKCPVSALHVQVPPSAVEFGRTFEQFLALYSDQRSLLPTEFVAREKEITQRLNQTSIRQFFETMGSELSRSAKTQWG
jgi:hypothetical protein